MIDFILLAQNMPFVIALTIMLMIAFLEGVTVVLGFGLSNMIETFLPDIDVDIVSDLDTDKPGLTDTGVLTKILGWFRIGQVPFLIILICFLTTFGLCGLFLQSLAAKITGHVLPGIIAVVIAFGISLPIVRFVIGSIARIMPKDETEVVSEKSFIGRVAVITMGRATKNNPAQAKMKDQFGTTHYIMIEPDIQDEVFEQGDHVLIVKRTGIGYAAIRNSVSALEDFD